jgi:hypothetical protein
MRHRKSDSLLMFPHVCHMTGRGCGYGSAVSFTAPQAHNPAIIGKQVLSLLKSLKSADIAALADKQEQRLRAMWRGEKELPMVAETDGSWSQIHEEFPVLLKGPGTYLRQFSECQLFERDSWKSRKLLRVVRGPERGTTRHTDECRIPLKSSAKELGERLLEFLAD